KLFNLEEIILKEVWKDELVGIFHIGSTSIPTIGFAKPIIDILIVVKDIDQVNFYTNEMVALGYVSKGENGIIGRRYFSKGQKRTHHVHIFQVGNKNINIHLQFKQFLISNPLEAKKYGGLKVNLAKQFPNEHCKYQAGKQPFLNELVSKAKEWASQKKDTY
ncbi:MAG: GrpB family protein, partial [Solibacillus sp.]